MGGDFGPPVTVPACLQILQRYPDLVLILVGDKVSLYNAGLFHARSRRFYPLNDLNKTVNAACEGIKTLRAALFFSLG